MTVPEVSIRCFGGVALEREGAPVAGRATQRRRLGLVLLLAGSPGHPVSRDRLASYLWPESEGEAGRHLLSNALYELRRVLGDVAILSRGDDIWLDPSVVRCDVALFEAAIERGAPDEALALYRGPFADGFHVSAAPDFERWLEEKRGRYQRSFRQALEAAAVQRIKAGDPRGAADAWLRSAAEDPADARVLMEAMRALFAAGNRTAALRQAATYEAFVRAEFGAEPVAEVVALAASLRRDESRSPSVAAEQLAAPISSASQPRPRSFARALLASTVVAAVMIAAAVGWFATRGSASPDTSSGVDLVRLAVLPFNVRGGPATAERRGEFAALLSSGLDGAGRIRAVRADSVLRWVAQQGGVDSANADEVARRFGARLYVIGEIHEAKGVLRVRAELRERDLESPLGVASAEGASDRPFELADALATQLLAEWLSSPAERLTSAAARTTRSLPALKAYIAGENARSAGRFAAAAEAFARAVEADSTFALGYYRLSMMTIAADLPWAQAVAAEERAQRYSVRLVDRDRLLVRAYGDFRQGDPESAEGIYRSLAAAYPDDAEALRQLGETLFHYNPLRGRPIAEARAPFERVLAGEPDDWDAMWHLAQLDAIEGRRAQALGLFDRLLALHPAPPQSLEVRVLRALTARDSVAEGALVAELRRADELQLHQIVWRSAVYVGDIAAAERIARLLIEPGRSRYARYVGHQDVAALLLARGQWRAAEAQLDASVHAIPTLRAEVTSARGRLSAFAIPPRPRSDVLALRDSVAATRPTAANQAAARLMILGVLDVTLGDTVMALARAAELERIAPSSAAAVRAAIARARSNADNSLRELERGRSIPWFGLALTTLDHSRTLERSAYADALRESGRHREALDWYGSFGEHSLHDLVFLAPSHLRRAELYERLAEPEKAAEHYARVVELWRDCDPDLRPLREQARARLTALRRR